MLIWFYLNTFYRHNIETFYNIFFSDFQNYLRTQTGNNTTVNIIISTVDYLLRVQVGSFCSVRAMNDLLKCC